MSSQVLYFTALLNAAVTAISSVVVSGVKKQALTGPTCFEFTGTRWFTFLPSWLNHLACTITTIFMATHQSPDVKPMLGLFGSIFIPATFIVTYDSFRPRTRANGAFITRLASLFLLLGQFVTAGVALPLYYTLYLATTGGIPQGRPKPEYVWTAVLSTVFGMLIPSVIMNVSEWSYTSVAAWQPFPIYMLILNLVLPPLLRRVVKPSSSPVVPILFVTITSALVSIKEHQGLIFGPSAIKDVFFPAYQGLGLGEAGHALFVVDLACAGFTMVSVVVLSLRASSAPLGLFGSAVLLFAGVVTLGPGAAMLLTWAWVELASKPSTVRKNA